MSGQVTALICGVSGQDGAYLARLLLDKGYRVIGTSRDATTSSFANLERLGISDRVETASMVLTDFRSVLQTLSRFEPDEIYNLAGQSSVGLSFQQPVETLDSIAGGTINLLEAVRFTGRPMKLYNAGSSECFGDTGGKAANEDTAFRPRSPYATAKATAHWAVANYREAYGLHACTGILFNHESPLRPARFVTRKIVNGACRIARDGGGVLQLGNLSVSRDWGWAPEYVDAMWRMLQIEVPTDYVIATGKSHTLQSFCDAVFAELGLDAAAHVAMDEGLKRPSDIAFGQGDASRAGRDLGWTAGYQMKDIVKAMVESEKALHD